jgi:DNA polymerase-3 subunit epsilon
VLREQNRLQAIQIAKEKLAGEPIFLDTETTGLKARDEIIEIAILDHDGEPLMDSLVRPTIRIPTDAHAIHGITDDMVKDAPTWRELWPEIEGNLRGKQLAIYNAEFDLRMMKQSHLAHGLRWDFQQDDVFCIMQLYAQFYGLWDPSRRSFRWQSLENAGRQCNIQLPNTHRAKDDTALAREVLIHMAGSET